jgi:hypothetical protein
MDKAESGVPVSGGELNIRVDITGLYELTK